MASSGLIQMNISCRKQETNWFSPSTLQAQFKLPLSELWGSGSNFAWTVSQMVQADRKGWVILEGGRKRGIIRNFGEFWEIFCLVRLLSPRLLGC